MENLSIWEKYKQVPSNALKPFDNGNFKGTDINTMWRIKCLTEHFGPCGKGWYPEMVRTWTEIGADGEMMCFVEIKLYVKYGEEWSKGMSATGGSKLISFVKSKGYTKNSDEGYKMAFTDALGVACKYLGFGADVYWDNDRTKYTDELGNKAPPGDKHESENIGSGQEVDPSTIPPTLVQISALKKVKRTLDHVSKSLGKDVKAVTAQDVTVYIKKVIAYQKEQEAKKQAEAEKEAQEIFGNKETELENQ